MFNGKRLSTKMRERTDKPENRHPKKNFGTLYITLTAITEKERRRVKKAKAVRQAGARQNILIRAQKGPSGHPRPEWSPRGGGNYGAMSILSYLTIMALARRKRQAAALDKGAVLAARREVAKEGV